MEETTQPSAIETREKEVADYEANIATYTAILSTLPNQWPEHLQQYRDATDRHKTAASITDLEDVILVSKLWYADDCHKAIRTETVEKIKAEAILAAIKN